VCHPRGIKKGRASAGQPEGTGYHDQVPVVPAPVRVVPARTRDQDHALAVAGGLQPLVTSRYGLVLLVKIAVFGLMLVLSNHGRKYAARVAFSRRHLPDSELGRAVACTAWP
jgi:hypothetical protein